MSENENSAGAKAGQKPTRHRSPGFPVMAIDDAIARLRLIYRQDKRAFTTAAAILSHLGFKSAARSGQSGRVIAALKQYGLLDENKGQFRVSDLGFRILHLPDDSPERAALVKEAALSPAIFTKILAYYGGDLPSDEALRSHLVLNEEFNPDSVEQFIRVLRRTVAIANPSPEDYTVGDESEGAESPPLGATPMQSTAPRPAPPQGRPAFERNAYYVERGAEPPLAEDESVLVFKISRDSEARVIFSGQVTQEAIDKLAALLNLSKDAYPTKAELEQPKERDEVDEAFGNE